jgi:hypothetical protein
MPRGPVLVTNDDVSCEEVYREEEVIGTVERHLSVQEASVLLGREMISELE